MGGVVYIENGITQGGEGNEVSLIIYSCSRQLLTSPQSYSNLPLLQCSIGNHPYQSVSGNYRRGEFQEDRNHRICDCGSESEDGDGIEMIRCPFILEHGAASNLSKVVWMWIKSRQDLWLHPISQGMLTVRI